MPGGPLQAAARSQGAPGQQIILKIKYEFSSDPSLHSFPETFLEKTSKYHLPLHLSVLEPLEEN